MAEHKLPRKRSTIDPPPQRARAGQTRRAGMAGDDALALIGPRRAARGSRPVARKRS